MRQLIKNLATNVAVIGMLCGSLPATTVIYAHEDSSPHEHTQDQKATDQPSSYVYSAPPDCSLSILARRSLQLFDQEVQDINISPAQAVYAETHIVKQLGDRWLEIGEKVTIDKTLVDEYAKKSQSLAPEQTAAWQEYATQADFDLSSISPETAPTTAAKTQTGGNTATNESQEKPVSPTSSPRSSSPAWYLWLIIGAALGGMYFMMDRPRKK